MKNLKDEDLKKINGGNDITSSPLNEPHGELFPVGYLCNPYECPLIKGGKCSQNYKGAIDFDLTGTKRILPCGQIIPIN